MGVKFKLQTIPRKEDWLDVLRSYEPVFLLIPNMVSKNVMNHMNPETMKWGMNPLYD